ncbi:MAG: crossover junction endodeoxyribonuclease RuvC [Microthrixaceae bacterium]
MFVLGIDPGLSRCGYCCLDTDGRTHTPVALGVLSTEPSRPVPERLAELAADLRGLFDEVRPAAVAVERVLFQVNVRTAISVGQASGLVLAEAAGRGCTVVEYSPNEVKCAVAGHGAADKDEVAVMVQLLLGLPAPPHPADAADAAAIALCHVAMAGAGVAQNAAGAGVAQNAAGAGVAQNTAGAVGS